MKVLSVSQSISSAFFLFPLTGNFASVVALFFVILIGRAMVMSGRITYSSESAMKEALQGTYTYYSDSGTETQQIVISGDKATYKWKYGNDMETEVAWLAGQLTDALVRCQYRLGLCTKMKYPPAGGYLFIGVIFTKV